MSLLHRSARVTSLSRRCQVVASAAVLAAVVSGCSGSTDDGAPGAASPTATSAETAGTPPATAGSPSTTGAPVSPSPTTAPQPVLPAPSDGLAPVPSRSLLAEPPVPLTSTARSSNGIRVHVTSTESVTSAGEGPGQVSGDPAVAFHVTLENGSGQPVSLALTTVAAEYGPESTPGLPVDGPPAAPLSGAVAAGAAAEAVYVFRIPLGERDRVTLSLRYSVDAPSVSFSGAVG